MTKGSQTWPPHKPRGYQVTNTHNIQVIFEGSSSQVDN